ncbi:MAG TPA: cobyric acid synthase [Azospirillaceae bacterium]|nr:cobyric acid synthase [Azospirillaceae bacterium]
MRALMLQGTGSDVGKSLVTAGLCRALVRRGLRVRPFKPQNMSNNAAVTADGGEIGRAQALQALACGVEPTVDMNPVLLKPQTDVGAQVVVRGRVAGTARALEYQGWKPRLMAAVLESFGRLRAEADIVLVEGAGSPAEVNLRRNDIANMGFARAAGVPVVLVADIDRGGVIASLVGTHAVLEPEDRAMVCGFLINRFRGDPALFTDGLAAIVERTGWRGFGVLPHLPAAAALPAEDAASLDRPAGHGADGAAGGRLTVAVPLLPRIANFDDLDPLRHEPALRVEMVPPGRPLPAGAALVLLPGTKATLADLAFLRAEGWDVDLLAHVRRGGRVLGLCGGYQMLGRRVADPGGIEGPPGEAPGLGLLDVETVLAGPKQLRRTRGALAGGAPLRGAPVEGYEIHMGRTGGPDADARPFAVLEGGPDGAASPDGRVRGTYLHGLFGGGAARAALLAWIGATGGRTDHRVRVEAALDAVADAVEAHLDVDGLLAASHG